jgi:hypothetical protein
LLNLFTEELLIDFCELIGSHSGENLASVVDFDAQESQLWYMSHTIHLAAMEVSKF